MRVPHLVDVGCEREAESVAGNGFACLKTGCTKREVHFYFVSIITGHYVSPTQFPSTHEDLLDFLEDVCHRDDNAGNRAATEHPDNGDCILPSCAPL